MSWLTADEALARLRTKPQTLYANVSRGRIAARPDPDDPRRSLYRQDDVERLATRGRGRRGANAVAAESIAWGEPVLETAISTIAEGRLVYRGVDAVALSETESLETVASLLWGLDGAVASGDVTSPSAPRHRGSGGAGAEADCADLVSAYRFVAELAATEMPTVGRSRTVLLADAQRVVGQVAHALAGPGDDPMHRRLARHWGRPGAEDALRRALVLLAEHELNASTFAARVAASTGAPLAAAVMAGLAALSGPLHGTASHSMAGLVAAAKAHGPEQAVREALQLGQPLPCFGHRLYPDGDVRAAALMASFPVPELFAAIAKAGEAVMGEQPNIDFALAAMTAAFDLPREAPLEIFALARSVGWIAHALEQVETGALIRPRARYVGV